MKKSTKKVVGYDAVLLNVLPENLRYSEAARVLNRSHATIRRMVADGTLQTIGNGTGRRIRKSSICTFVTPKNADVRRLDAKAKEIEAALIPAPAPEPQLTPEQMNAAYYAEEAQKPVIWVETPGGRAVGFQGIENGQPAEARANAFREQLKAQRAQRSRWQQQRGV